MAGSNQDNSALNKCLRLTAQLLDEYVNQKEIVAKNPHAIVADAVEPVNCEALYDLIQAAQRVYTENCPGP